MLSLFKIRNFKSILDMTVDFRYNEGKAPNGWQTMSKLPFLEIDKENRFVTVLSLSGANASGKSNVIEAFKILFGLLEKQITLSKAFYPNKLNKKYNTTSFEVEFFVGTDKFNYFLEYDYSKIISEKLSKNNEIVCNISLPNIFDMSGLETGSYDTEKFREFFNIEMAEKDVLGQQIQIKTFLGGAIKKFPGLDNIASINKFVTSQIIIQSTEFAEDMEHYGFISLKEITSFVRKLDIDIANIIKKDDQAAKAKFTPRAAMKTIHKDTEGRDVEMDMMREESLGTNLLFGIAEVVLSALKDGTTLIIDELDRSLHPFLLTRIIELFKDRDYNKKNAQLVFTCHSTDILENQILRISEVAIITKNLKDGSTIKRLSDFDDVRNSYDLRKMYLNGKFGGIPFPYI